MITQLLKKKELHFERSFAAPIEAVWSAWTEADRLREWWHPDKTTVTDCEVDLRVGGRIFVITLVSDEMGKYAGTRWPMDGTFTRIDELRGLSYDAKSWTEGDEDSATITHTNVLTLSSEGERTLVTLHVTITDIGPKAKLAAFGMKWGYKSYLDALGKQLAGPPNH